MPLTDPVPSSSFDVLERNIQDTDKFVNQETGTFTNRVGKEIKPIPAIEAEANAAVISLGWHQVGLFADGFTYLLQNDIAKDAAGDWYRWNGALPKVVTAGTLPSSDANFVKIDYKSHAELSNRNAAGAHDEIYYRSFSNAANMIAFEGLEYGTKYSSGQTLWEYNGFSAGSIADFTPVGPVYTDDFTENDLVAAISVIPANGELRLGVNPMIGKITVVRDNLSIIGNAMPFYSADGTKLENGSIIKGFFIIDGDNLTLENFGVDSGVDACDELNAGNEMEGFVCHPTITSPVRLNRNNHLKNIIGLAKSPESPVHACLIEGLEDSSTDNIHGRRGQFGIVYKVVRTQIGKSTGYENGFSGVYLKSNSYAPVIDVNMSHISYHDMGAGCTNPIFFHADDAPMSDVNVGLLNVEGGDNQISLQSDASGLVNVISRLNIDKANARLGSIIGFTTFGYNYDVTIDQLNIFDTASGNFLKTHFLSRNVNLLDVNITAIAAPTVEDAVVLQGWTNYGRIMTNAFYNIDNKLNLLFNTNSLGGFKCNIGKHNAVLNIDLTAADLMNGWAVRNAGRPAGCRIENGICKFFGRLSPDNLGAGKEQFFQLDPWVTSKLINAGQFVCNVVGGATVDVVRAWVDTSGAVTFPLLNTAGQWPTFDAFTFIDLSGIEFEIDSPSA